jgi:chromosome segregation ATPase
MRLEEVVDELYGLDASEFTATRDGRARDARQAGDRALAQQLKALKRPSAAAWVANILVRQRPQEVERLVQFGESFREAQANLAGDELRRLGRQRHQVLSAVAQEAQRLAEARGQQVSQATLREVESTLEAAVSDPQAADALRSGRLLRSLSHTGMGQVDLSDAVAAPEVSVRPTTSSAASGSIDASHADRTRSGQDQRADKIAAAREALEDAEADVERAEHRVATAEHAIERAGRRRDEIERRVRALEEDVQRAREELSATTAEIAQTHEQRDACGKALDVARSQAKQTRARLRRIDTTGLRVVRDPDDGSL